MLVLFVIGGMIAHSVSLALVNILVAYIGLNILYSTARIKDVPFIEIALVASGFVFRVLAGSVAIGFQPQIVLFGSVFCLALGIVCLKRYLYLYNFQWF